MVGLKRCIVILKSYLQQSSSFNGIKGEQILGQEQATVS